MLKGGRSASASARKLPRQWHSLPAMHVMVSTVLPQFYHFPELVIVQGA